MAVFERVKKAWKLHSLKPVEQAQKEAENPEKYRQPKVKKSEMSKNTPKERLEIARETAQQKAEKEGPDEKAEREQRKAEKLAAFEEERREAAARCAQQEDKFRD